MNTEKRTKPLVESFERTSGKTPKNTPAPPPPPAAVPMHKSNTITRNEIIEQMVYHYKTAGTDGYGQLDTIMVSNVISMRDPKQMELLQEIVQVSTYGGRFGTYKGFRPFGAFKDKEAEERCKAAFRLNKSRIQNENNW